MLAYGTTLVEKMAYSYLNRLDGQVARQLQGFTRLPRR